MGIIIEKIISIVQYILIFVLVITNVSTASDTMLMFVGEDLEVLTIASRREEAAWSAPAIADVITGEEIAQKGAVTISQALEGETGFYMNQTEKGTIPYLRGIPNSTLFLFDTMPMGSGVGKSDTNIDYETSLAAVKRLEIVRGAGSVLWGPDAFAGIVNAVPLTGRDVSGVETGVILSSEDAPGEAYLNYGHAEKNWSSFLSVSGRLDQDDEDPFNVVKFWNDQGAEPVDTRYGQGYPEASRYVNIYGSAGYRDWLTLSVKISDTKNAYTTSDWDKEYLWQEQAAGSAGMFKVEASRKINADSGIRFTGYYSGKDQDHMIVDREFNSGESSLFGEIIYDRSLFYSKGLATLGTSWRQDEYDSIWIWDSFPPGFFRKDNDVGFIPGSGGILPTGDQIDFKNSLGSVFGQYRHEFNAVELLAGARYDDHDAYEDKVSYNAGAVWKQGNFIFKALYGTAYRSPSAKQVQDQVQEQEGGVQKLEKIENINAQLSWKTTDTQAAVTVFRNEIENHVIEDRYEGLGLSTPNSQAIDGIELEFSHKLTNRFKLAGNLTLLDNSGPNETYFYKYNIIGNSPVYIPVEYPYDTGADVMGAVKGIWQITDRITLVPEIKYISERTLYFYELEDDGRDVQVTSRGCDDAWIMDVNLLVKEVFPFDLGIYVNNLFDQAYSSPGLYSVTENDSLNVGFMIRMNW